MKKVLFSLAVVALFAATSCKKDYTCECTTTSTVDGVDDFTSEVELLNVSKSDAEDACDAADISTGVTTTSCDLK